MNGRSIGRARRSVSISVATRPRRLHWSIIFTTARICIADIRRSRGAPIWVGGFSATYLRRGHVVLIPVRLGVGARLGVNVGYLKFSEKNKWLPF